ncbi:MAG: pyridoxamine 5'-phosphate oxidase family protein [Lentisphaeraceae bacterium]|nr:pyridoxamine 5'-phosphate oxidase family protein [Lentisphaeraceae bacterium]
MTTTESSPFHEGELQIQKSLGVAEKMAVFGKKVIRSFIPKQHRQFFQDLPFIILSHADQNENCWTSLLTGELGFIQSPTDTSLIINQLPTEGDPLNAKLHEGMHLGILGIMLYSKRRNRLSVVVDKIFDHGFSVKIKQCFGNCPKYIKHRSPRMLQPEEIQEVKVSHFDHFDSNLTSFISEAETFFVGSYKGHNLKSSSDGTDASHRGGEKGFIQVNDEKTLTIPDYSGNFHFNTLGNFLITPKAGLLFINFETGDLVTMTGTPKVLFDPPSLKDFPAAERLWTFQISHGYIIKNSSRIVWE